MPCRDLGARAGPCLASVACALCLRLPSSLPFFSGRLLRQARLLLPWPHHCRRGCCICTGLCLPRGHRFVPVLLPLLDSSTLAVFWISCVVHGFRRFPLPVLAVARRVLAACTRTRQGQGSAGGALAEVPNTPPKMQAVRVSKSGDGWPACSR